MNLDLLDKKIIYELDKCARQSASQIGKKLKIAKETINFRIKRLLKNNVIKGFYPVINNSLINQFFYKIFIKFEEINPERREQILNFLITYPQIGQVLLLEGKYDVQLLFLAKDNYGLMEFMDKLNSFCGKEIKEKIILIIDSMYRFNLKFFYNPKEETKTIVTSKKQDYKFDKISWKVLQEISKDARKPILEIAKILNLSPQLTQYHLKKLIKDKVILSTHLAINYNKLNLQHYHLTFQINDPKALPKIIQFFNSKNKSMFATKMIGKYDGSAEIVIKDNQELRKFVDELRTNYSNYINTLDIFLVYKEYKLRLYPI